MAEYDPTSSVNDEAKKPIKDYCASRNYKCRGCRYSIKWIAKDYKGKSATCVFGDCPCSWPVE